MLYTRIDYLRKYSVLRTLDAAGNRVKNARIDHQQPEAFAAYFANLPEVSRVVKRGVLELGLALSRLRRKIIPAVAADHSSRTGPLPVSLQAAGVQETATPDA